MPPAAPAFQPPAGAVRNGELEAWEVAERDASGTRHGDCTLYRDDGSLLLRCRYEAGKRNGPFTSYHPNGDVESEGGYVEGTLDGAFFRYTSEQPGSAPLRSCCVPRGARKLRVNYRRGVASGETFYDGAGRALRSDGTLAPERAPGVPEAATFEEGEDRWVERLGTDDGSLLRRSFDLDGQPVDETEIARGKRVRLREYHPSGGLARELHFDDGGVVHGECTFRFSEPNAPYADRAIREVRGAFEHGQAVGRWRFLDDGGRELAVQERGEALSDERLAELFGPSRDPASVASNASGESLERRATELFHAKRVREALLFAACAATRTGRTQHFIELLTKVVVPLAPEAATARAVALDREDAPTVRAAFDALLDGGEPAQVLRLLATLLPPALPEARLLVDAALLLAPRNPRAFLTRALIRIEQGDRDGALADLDELDAELAPAAERVRDLVRIVFPTFRFSPTLEPEPQPIDDLAPVGVEQPLDAVRRTIGLYVTRLSAMRAELRARLGAEPEWLPPDLASLLEAGSIEPQRFTATITDEDENGSESSEVSVDETLDPKTASTVALMIAARAEWDALAWLCWSAGLDEVALPSKIEARPNFAAAVNDSMQRHFRVRDQVRTAGLVSRSRGVPGFTWEGLSVDALEGRLAEIAERQFFERRAMFFYLLFPQNLSPFQSDLRQAQ